MVKKPLKVVLDTNIIISALGFGGKPRNIYNSALNKEVSAFTSSILIAELQDVVSKKFPKFIPVFPRIRKMLRKKFKITQPTKIIKILSDEPDNRVLEAAYEAKCDYIITGDKDLIALRKYKKIKIVTADEFLKINP